MPPSMSAPARGIVSQPSMSASLMIADTRPVGSMIWTEHGQKIWGLAKVVSQANTILIVRRETGEEAEIDLGFGETYPHNPKVVADMTALHHIHEAGILHNLGKRAKDQKPYTFMGTILIAVNPLRPIPDPSADEYVDRPLNPETPHPYAIAELSYYQMRLGAGRTGSNQSIVVSGESGAGKTESSKVILRYLTRRSKGGVTGLEQKVVDSSPILESFGNAKTLRNNNSSRFGKFLKMQFTQDKYRLAGAFIETYLLEKSRVLSQGQGERNFHILYELVAGAKKCGLAAELQLEGPEAYHVLSDSGCTTLEGVDDAAQFEAVRKACGTIGMDEATQNQVWKMLAAVLHMSNVAFDAKDDAEGEVAAVRDAAALERLSALMGVEAALLEAMLTRRVVKTGREEFTKKLGVQDAALSRDAVVKALFQALFLWIVRVINESLGKGAESLPFIGVLDIFGFENFEHSNEFEQLLINFTNENLQDTFNKQVFENELQLYQSEGIEVEVSSCPDNAECLAMLSAATTGVIPRLNNVCRELNACDDRFLATLHKEFKGHQHFPSTSQRDMRQCFWVKHYAGSVKYTVKGWVARNMDNVPQTFAPSLKSSKFKVVREMADVNGAEGTQKRKNTLMKPTVAKAFLESMKGLNATLLNTKCNFVRCIKPNAQMECGVYDNKYVVEQLQCLGILQTCEVLKVGMPTRVTYTDLKEVLGSEAAEADKLFKGEPETALIAAILWAFEVPSEAFRLGRTRVFFRAGQISTLQKILNETTADDARRISDRLREALEKRHAAKAAAEEAQAAMSKAERGVKEAETAAESVLGKSAKGEGEDDQLQLILSRTFSAASPSAVSEDELHDLESTAKMARTAGSTARKIGLMIEAAELDDVGKYAKGAMDRLLAGSREALASIEDAASRAVRLEAEVKEVRGTDEAAALRELAGMLKSLRCEVKVGKQLTEATMEAAAKCQVEKTRELTEKAKTKASSVEVQARAVAGVAKGAAKASERQQAALGKAKASAQGVASAGEKARLAFSSFRELLETITGEEERAKVAKIAADELDRSVKAEKAAAAAATAAAAAAEAAASAAQTAPLATERGTPTSDGGKDASSAISPSPAPVDRRSSGIKMGRSSVRDMLSSEMAKSPVVSPSPRARPKPDVYQPDIKIEVEKGPKHGRRPKLQRGATQRFNEAMSESFVQGHLITPYGMLDRPARRFFVLSDGFLTHYEKKSLVNTNKHKRMKLTSSSVTVRANRPNTFGVVTKNANGRGQVHWRPKNGTTWMLMAQHKAQMEGWMTAINDQINALFVRENNVSDDDYENQGKCGQFFYEMLAGAKPQYIRLFPMANAPRTGGGLFEREIIEVTQVLKVDDVEFLRMAGDRGWACSRDVEGGGGQVFTEFRGELVKDTHVYTVPMVGGQLAVVVYGPHMEAQPTGDSIAAGKNVRAVQRFTSAPKSDGQTTTFIKLGGSYHGGWVVLTQGKGMVGLVPARR